MIEIEMVTTAGRWEKGKRYIVGHNHWLARSGYAKVVGEIELVAPVAVVDPVPADDRGRVARRRSKKVNSVQDSAGSGSGSDLGADGRSGSGGESGVAVSSGDEADGSEESGAPVGQSEA
jgi:hypothetical protein